MTDYAQLYRAHGGFLRSYCYRLTGSMAVAEDLVHDTFLRAMQKPPADLARSWRPWLVRVATNRARDRWRSRRREHYIGSWLPSPIETGGESEPTDDSDPGAERRYELLESVSFAFLLALEALTASQRAVLILRDVYGYSTEETAAALEISFANVKTTLHRARRALREYDPGSRAPDDRRVESTETAIARLIRCLANDDVDGMERLLAAGVRQRSDAGGRYHAARKPVVGRETVAKFLFGINRLHQQRGGQMILEVRRLNGYPALWVELVGAPEDIAPRFAMLFDVDDEGRVTEIYSVLAPEKLAALERAGA